MMRQLAKMAEDRLRRRGLSGRMFVLRNNTDDHGNSWGCHENLMVARSVEVGELVKVLAPFMATRPIWGGAGGLIPDGLGGVKYVYSPRIPFIEVVAGTSTSTARPLVNLRDESHAGPQYRRLHLLAGDTNMAEVQNFVKMGVSGALLEMMERRRRLPEFSFDPVAFMHAIAEDFGLRKTVRVGSGGLFTALDVQEAYCEAVEAEAERSAFDEETARAVRMWRELLEALRRADWSHLETRVDWVRKRLALDALLEGRGVSLNSSEARYLDFIYHAVDERNAAFEKLHKIHPAVSLTKPAEVKAALSVPPAGRATARGKFVSKVLAGGKAATIDWERWAYEGDDEMWEILDPAEEDPGMPVLKTAALWESKSAVRSQLGKRTA